VLALADSAPAKAWRKSKSLLPLILGLVDIPRTFILIINIRSNKHSWFFARLWHNLIVQAGHIQAVFRQGISTRNFSKVILEKIQDLKQGVPIVNIGLRNGWL
jgi:hypothetical protein